MFLLFSWSLFSYSRLVIASVIPVAVTRPTVELGSRYVIEKSSATLNPLAAITSPLVFFTPVHS